MNDVSAYSRRDSVRRLVISRRIVTNAFLARLEREKERETFCAFRDDAFFYDTTVENYLRGFRRSCQKTVRNDNHLSSIEKAFCRIFTWRCLKTMFEENVTRRSRLRLETF